MCSKILSLYIILREAAPRNAKILVNEVDFLSRDEILANILPKFSPEAKEKIRATRRFSADMLVMLSAAAVMAWYYYGERAIRLILVSVVTAAAAEYLGSKIFGADSTLSDLSAVAAGASVALCLPASSPYWLACLGASFASLAAKLPFGTARGAIFSPAAAGLAFVCVCAPEKFFAYPAVPSSGGVPPPGSEGFAGENSIALMLSRRNSIGLNVVNYIDVLIGNVAGPMGATCALLMFGCLLYLLLRRPKSFQAAGSFVLVCLLYALLFPRVLTGRRVSAFMELCGGMLLFCAVFFLSDEAILPERTAARLTYGAAAGLLCMLMRTLGTQEESAVFAVLIANALAPAFDRLPRKRSVRVKEEKEGV